MSRILSLPPLGQKRQPHLTEWHWKAMRKQVAGDTGGAMVLWARLLERNPHDAKALYFQALCYSSIRELPRAIAYMQACLAEVPTHADAWFNLGTFLRDSGREREALQHFIAALEHEPEKVEALTEAGKLFRTFGDESSALGCFHMALAQDTTRPEALYNRSFIRLLDGDYETGWAEYEARWKCAAYIADYHNPAMKSIPRWECVPDSAETEGKILLHGEQGAGDVLMMLRYVEFFAEERLVIEVPRAMVTLCALMYPKAAVIARGDALPDGIAWQCPMMSLPFAFRALLKTIPRPINPERLAHIPKALPCDCGLLHVGLCWAGADIHPNDRDRSAPPGTFTRLLHIDGIHWTSLQVGPRASEYPELPPQTLSSYLHTAALMRVLDIVVTVDTSVAHLAGVLGMPAYICTPSNPEWRWLLNRDTSPWYPSALLVRRDHGTAWDGVVEALAAHLRERVIHRAL